MYNITAIKRGEDIFIEYYELPLPDRKQFRGWYWDNHKNDAYGAALREVDKSKQSVIVKKEYRLDFEDVLLARLLLNPAYPRDFREFWIMLEKGINIDSLKNRIEIVPEWSARKNDGKEEKYITGQYAILKPEQTKPKPQHKPITEHDMYMNMQYYMEYCLLNDYVTPQEWIEKYKHF